jgi:hypothetical protein
VFNESAEAVRRLGDFGSHLFDAAPHPVQHLANLSRFLFDTGASRDDSGLKVIGPEAAIQANTECGVECRDRRHAATFTSASRF